MNAQTILLIANLLLLVVVLLCVYSSTTAMKNSAALLTDINKTLGGKEGFSSFQHLARSKVATEMGRRYAGTSAATDPLNMNISTRWGPRVIKNPNFKRNDWKTRWDTYFSNGGSSAAAVPVAPVAPVVEAVPETTIAPAPEIEVEPIPEIEEVPVPVSSITDTTELGDATTPNGENSETINKSIDLPTAEPPSGNLGTSQSLIEDTIRPVGVSENISIGNVNATDSAINESFRRRFNISRGSVF